MPDRESASRKELGPRPATVHPLQYYAFLSYSHADEAMAGWLHDSLEKFRTPSSLTGRLTGNGAIPGRLTPIFRDRQELSASEDLGGGIRQALSSSRFLIVLCSPAAAASRWVNAEIDMFKRQRPDGCVLAAIVAGEPFASDSPARASEECLPPALRQKYDRRGRPTAKRAEPLAADLRDDRDGKRLGMLKLVAGMLGVGLDELVQRETLRRQRRLAIVAAASLAGMAITSTLAVVAVDARDAARDQRREAEGLVGFMLGDLRSKLEPLGRLDVLDSVGARALQYYEQQDKSELSDEALAQRSRALTLMGEIAHTRGNLDRALRLYQEALASTAEAVKRAPDNAQRMFDHAQNVFWVGYIDWQRGRLDRAEAAFREYKRLAQQMTAADPGKAQWRLESIYADTNLGSILLETNRYREAQRAFRRGLTDIEALVASGPRNRAYQDQLSETLAYLSDAEEFSGALDSALGQRERQLALLEKLAASTGADAPMKHKMMVAHRAIGRLLASRGDLKQGLDHSATAVAIGSQLIQLEPGNSEWAEHAAGSYIDLGELQLADRRTNAASASARSACGIASRLVERDQTVVAWRAKLTGDCLALRARIALAGGWHDEARALALQNIGLARAESSAKSPDSRFALATALAMQGLVASEFGNQAESREAFRSALAKWPTRVELTPHRLARLTVIFEGAGRQRDAAGLAARLNAMGYRHPIYLQDRVLVKRGQ